MTRIDRVVLRRLAGRIGLTLVVLFGLIALAESLNVWRFQHLSTVGGPLLGVLAIVTEAARWTLGTLPVSLLIGAILGLLDLQVRRELTIIKASGISIWRVLRAPLIATVLVALVAALVVDTGIVLVSRALSISPQAANAGQALWLQQEGEGEHYVVFARHPHPDGRRLEDVTIFLTGAPERARVLAPLIELRPGAWHVPEGIMLAPEAAPRPVVDMRLATRTTAGDMGIALSSPSALTLFELWQAREAGITDPKQRHAVETRLARLLTLPLVLTGSLLLAFAFTGGYHRTNKYGRAVLYGIVVGLVVYVVTEMASVAGTAGIVAPLFAAVAPALVAMVIGTTVLLYREDGRVG